MPETKDQVVVSLAVNIADGQVNDLLISAVEGGINYWASGIKWFTFWGN